MDKTKDQSYKSRYKSSLTKLSLSIYSEKGLSIRHQEKHFGVKWSYSTGLIMSSPWKRSSQKNSRPRLSVEERIFEYREKMAGEISAGRRLWTRYFRFKNVESSLTSSSARPRSGTTWWSQGLGHLDQTDAAALDFGFVKSRKRSCSIHKGPTKRFTLLIVSILNEWSRTGIYLTG